MGRKESAGERGDCGVSWNREELGQTPIQSFADVEKRRRRRREKRSESEQEREKSKMVIITGNGKLPPASKIAHRRLRKLFFANHPADKPQCSLARARFSPLISNVM